MSATLERIRQEAAVRTLAGFVRYMWDEIHPGTPLAWNWHLDLMFSKLEAVTRGEVDQLVIAVPPGTLKSVGVSVMWSAWWWLLDPSLQSLWYSGSGDVASRDSRRCRHIIQSAKYQALIRVQMSRIKELGIDPGPYAACMRTGKPWALAKDQNEKVNYANTLHGFRECMSIGSRTIGKRGRGWVIDDPVDVAEVINAPAAVVQERMAEVETTVKGRLWNRVNDSRRGMFHRVLIMQMVDMRDLANTLIADGFDHLVLPMEYDPDHPYRHPDDPRKEKGELLFPERFPRDVCDDYRMALGPAQYSAQYLQLPKPAEGGMLEPLLEDAEWYWEPPWKLQLDQLILSVDASGGGKKATSSRTAMAGVGAKGAVRYLLTLRAQTMTYDEQRMALIEESTAIGTYRALDAVVVEDKAFGPALINDLKRIIPLIEGFNPGRDSKSQRAGPLAAAGRAGQIALPHPDCNWIDWVEVDFTEVALAVAWCRRRGHNWPSRMRKDSGLVKVPWIVLFIAEALAFPHGGRDDIVDTFAQAYLWLQRPFLQKTTRMGAHTPVVDTTWMDGGGGGAWTGEGGY